jgi:hypothetical protein
MKINSKTLSVLKNFAGINPSIIVKPGNVVKTLSGGKTVLARAVVPDTFEKQFAIYNMSQFIACISMFTNPDLDFGETSVRISDTNKSFTYHYADPSIIVSPPDKDITVPSEEARFRLTNADFSNVAKALGILGVPEVAVVGDGDKIMLQAVDSKTTSSNFYSVDVGETDKVFRAIFKSENLKMIPDDYEVVLSSAGISKFSGAEATYFVAIEASSTF